MAWFAGAQVGIVALSLSAASCSLNIDLGSDSAPDAAASRREVRKRAPIARERGFVETDDGARVYYEKLGAGPALVLIHGLGGNHAVWFRQVPVLARTRTVVTISQRGFAPSSPIDGSYRVDRLVADLLAVLDALEIEQADVVGQSMGGWTALGIALAHPARVRSVVLADTLAGISDDRIATHYEHMQSRARDVGRAELPLASHPALDEEFSATHPEEAYLYQALSTFGSPSPAKIAAQLGDARFSHDDLDANRIPVLFLVGERDRIFPPDVVAAAAAYLSNARVVTMKEAGHSPYFETPTRWRQTVEAFLESTDVD